MRILQICSARDIGGGERHLVDLANALVARGHEVFAAIRPSSPLLAELSSLPTENIIELPMRNVLSLGSALRLSRYVREHEIQIIHAHVARDYPLAALATRRSQARLVLTRHVLFPLGKIHHLTLRRTARVIAVSGAVADALRAQNIFAPDRIVTIHNGIDVDRFEKRRKDAAVDSYRNKMISVGVVGHLGPIKGHEDFIRAAAIICSRRDDVEFVIAGEDKSRTGEHRRELEKLIDDLGLNQRVRLVGWVADVARLLPTLSLFVSASRAEPFGLSIIEAMAAGVPVIATRSEGALEIIDTDQSGRLVTIGDVEALAKAMAELLDDQSERERLARNAQVVVRERFSLASMIDKTEQLYRGMMSAAG